MNQAISQFKTNLKNNWKNIHLVGLSSIEGAAMASFLIKEGHHLTVHDFSTKESLTKNFQSAHLALSTLEKEELWHSLKLEQAPSKITLNYQESYLKDIEKADAIFVGQNWKNYNQNLPRLSTLKALKKIPFLTLMDLYFAYSPAPICGVTGTNGKTTTINWLRHLLTPSKKCLQGGNDLFHPQCLHRLSELSPDDFLLLEISNRQLEWLSPSPFLGIITNIAEDHLTEHGGFEGYSQIKKKLVQRETQIAVLNQEDPQLAALTPTLKADTYSYGFSPCRGLYCQNGQIFTHFNGPKKQLLTVSEMTLQSKHLLLNGMAAALSALLLGVSAEEVSSGLKDFTGVRNRIQKVATLSGIDYINDMACTSPHAAIAALDSIESPVHLICGGDQKGADFSLLNEKLAEKVTSLILLPGSLEQELHHPQTYKVKTLKEAIQCANQYVKTGETVLFSPIGCGFFNRYVKGQHSFQGLVKRLFRERNNPHHQQTPYSHTLHPTS